MHARRNTALTELKRLAEELRNSNIVSSNRPLVEELGQTCIWASNAGTRSNMAEIQVRIESITTMVRVLLINSLRFMPYPPTLLVYVSVGIKIQEGVVGFTSV